MIDLSILSIPPVSVVPEPTNDLAASVLSLAATAAKQQGPCGVDQVLFSFVRRCRELEAESLRLRKCDKCGLTGGPTCTGMICDECKSELEAEVERLRKSREDENDILATWPGNC